MFGIASIYVKSTSFLFEMFVVCTVSISFLSLIVFLKTRYLKKIGYYD